MSRWPTGPGRITRPDADLRWTQAMPKVGPPDGSRSAPGDRGPRRAALLLALALFTLLAVIAAPWAMVLLSVAMAGRDLEPATARARLERWLSSVMGVDAGRLNLGRVRGRTLTAPFSGEKSTWYRAEVSGESRAALLKAAASEHTEANGLKKVDPPHLGTGPDWWAAEDGAVPVSYVSDMRLFHIIIYKSYILVRWL
jgi:hypothetical protein